jgi:hypothetical protein
MPKVIQTQITPDAATWTDVVATINCNRVIFHNPSPSVDVKRRTDKNVATTQRVIPPGSEEIWDFLKTGAYQFKFHAGDVLASFQTASGTFTINILQG